MLAGDAGLAHGFEGQRRAARTFRPSPCWLRLISLTGVLVFGKREIVAGIEFELVAIRRIAAATADENIVVESAQIIDRAAACPIAPIVGGRRIRRRTI